MIEGAILINLGLTTCLSPSGGEAGECLYTGLTVPGMVQKCLMALCKRQMSFSLTHNTRTRMTSTKTVLGEFRQKNSLPGM